MNDSIFGSNAPKIQSGATTVNLDYWLSTKEEDKDRSLSSESEISAERAVFDRGSFLEIEGKIFLFRYGDLTAQTSKFNDIYQFNRQNVLLWKHRDGVNYKDKDGNDVYFYMTVTPSSLDNLDNRDVLLLTFKSLTAVDFSNSI